MMFKKEKSFIAILCCIMLVCVPVIMVTHSFAAETQSPGDIVKNTKTKHIRDTIVNYEFCPECSK